MPRLFAALTLLFLGLALVYWAWQPRGREEALALGMVLVIFAVPLLLSRLPISGGSGHFNPTTGCECQTLMAPRCGRWIVSGLSFARASKSDSEGSRVGSTN